METHNKLPPFNEDGLLPPGDYELTLEELALSSLVARPIPTSAGSNWDIAWRRQLVANLEILVHHLWVVGVSFGIPQISTKR